MRKRYFTQLMAELEDVIAAKSNFGILLEQFTKYFH